MEIIAITSVLCFYSENKLPDTAFLRKRAPKG